MLYHFLFVIKPKENAKEPDLEKRWRIVSSEREKKIKNKKNKRKNKKNRKEKPMVSFIIIATDHVTVVLNIFRFVRLLIMY